MKRILLYVLILAAVLVLPTKGMDVGKLQPVQTIAVFRKGERWVIKTDTEDVGVGASVEAAFENLMETTPAVICLDAADYLLVQNDTLTAIDVLRPKLKGSILLYQYIGNPDLKDVSKYLSVHGENTKLKHWSRSEELPILDCTTARFSFS